MKIICSKSNWLQPGQEPPDKVSYSVIADSGEIFYFFADHSDVQLCHFAHLIGDYEGAVRRELARPDATIIPEDVPESKIPC